MKEARTEWYRGEAIKTVMKFESEQRALSCFVEDHTHAVVLELRLRLISVGYGAVFLIWGKRRAQTCMASVFEEM